VNRPRDFAGTGFNCLGDVQRTGEITDVRNVMSYWRERHAFHHLGLFVVDWCDGFQALKLLAGFEFVNAIRAGTHREDAPDRRRTRGASTLEAAEPATEIDAFYEFKLVHEGDCPYYAMPYIDLLDVLRNRRTGWRRPGRSGDSRPAADCSTEDLAGLFGVQ
jgi:hypothetical protein